MQAPSDLSQAKIDCPTQIALDIIRLTKKQMGTVYASLPDGKIRNIDVVLGIELPAELEFGVLGLKRMLDEENSFKLKYQDYDLFVKNGGLSAIGVEKHFTVKILDASSIIFGFDFTTNEQRIQLKLFVDTNGAEEAEFYTRIRDLKGSKVIITPINTPRPLNDEYSQSTIFDLLYGFAKRLEFYQP
jgi:hypothetical protein